jgi:hypothetical protein
VAKPDEKFEYQVFFKSYLYNHKLGDSINTDITQWLRTYLASPYKVYRERIAPYALIKSIKLDNEGDLMMFMLCYREHVRKIFKMVKEPQ